MALLSTIKEELYRYCEEYVARRIESCRVAISEAQEAANHETKGSSGDKYETGRAMAQLEIEKNSQQLSESLKLRNALEKIRVDSISQTVQAGSLVVTDRGAFFIAISLGRIVHNGIPYFVIAPGAPLGLALSHAKVGDTVTFNGQGYFIKELI